jgi:hypothetical protein
LRNEACRFRDARASFALEQEAALRLPPRRRIRLWGGWHSLVSEAFMRNTGYFNLEWGYLAPAPSFLRSVRLVVVAATIAATASAAVVFALVRQPAAEASVAARTLAPPVEVASAPKVPVAAELQTQSEHASMPDAQHAAGATRRQSTPAVAQTGTTSSAAGGSGIASKMSPAPVAAAVAETSRVTAQASPKSPNKKVHEAAPAKDPAPAASRCVGAERRQTDSAAAGAQCRRQ